MGLILDTSTLVTAEIALLAGKISGREAERGITLPCEDLLIGATAWVVNFARSSF